MKAKEIISLVILIVTKIPDLVPVLKKLVEFIKWAKDLWHTTEEKFPSGSVSPTSSQKDKLTEIKTASYDNALTNEFEARFQVKLTPEQASRIRSGVDQTQNPKRKFAGGKKP